MLAVKLICVGKMRERFYIDAFAEYSKRLSAYCRFECVELAEQRLPEKPSEAEIEAALNREALEIEKQIPPDAYVVALCVEGKQVPSETIADLISGRENVILLFAVCAMKIGSRAILRCEPCQVRKEAAVSSRQDVLRGCPV